MSASGLPPENQKLAARELPLWQDEARLVITVNLGAGTIELKWLKPETDEVLAQGAFLPGMEGNFSHLLTVQCLVEHGGVTFHEHCSAWAASTRALLKRLNKVVPFNTETAELGLLSDFSWGPVTSGTRARINPGRAGAWRYLGMLLLRYAQGLKEHTGGSERERGRRVLLALAGSMVGTPVPDAEFGNPALFQLSVTFNQIKGSAEFVWRDRQGAVAVSGEVRPISGGTLRWQLRQGDKTDSTVSARNRESIRQRLTDWIDRHPSGRGTFKGYWLSPSVTGGAPVRSEEPPFDEQYSPYRWMEDNLVELAEALTQAPPAVAMPFDPGGTWVEEDLERLRRRMLRKEQKRQEEEARRQEAIERLAAARKAKEQEKAKARRELRTPPAQAQTATPERPPLPPVPVRVEFRRLELQVTAFAAPDLREYRLREQASLWWISNQSDDLLCVPHCNIQRLEYQLRTALRVLGPLRGRALLSDEVGLGKTIEAGLVIKELLIRGMVKRFLVLTVPSLVDQWAEELLQKFGLTVATTNQSAARGDPAAFWSSGTGVVASLHTVKQPGHLEAARQVQWDILVVDEAHYLRNRESQAWQAVNALPRQFLLLLTATPVQNSLEDLYNLVTLLQPGQLPSPGDFRKRFLDPKRPRQPREPEELRRLLGQVMIRNTRANSGVELPPRRAETVLFKAEAAEAEFWGRWEAEFRSCLGRLKPGPASLWGRLALQSAGSSPQAWRASLAKFPEEDRVEQWLKESVAVDSWERKCELLLPLCRGEGGVVIFSQFLETQSALASFLKARGVGAFVINGGTPAVEREPITRDFQRHGGALLLTHSGTEGRNLQFSHRLVNFDLPWNPMEIEQRIGRLHRLGQRHPVRIYNFVQAGTLQEHLLEVLQEKLNLFELVVGETGLVLGERYGSEEFADEVLRLWRENEGRVAEAFGTLGDQLAAARGEYAEVKRLDETLFAQDYESL